MLPVQYMKFKSKRRIIVVSDIHANYEGFTSLLRMVNYTRRDYLVIDGDITEKGPESLKTLTFIMMLAKHNDVYCVKGNCDNLFFRDWNNEHEVDLLWEYITTTAHSLWWEMFEILELKVKTKEDFLKAVPLVHEKFKVELGFLESLPTVIETPNLTFVHAGLQSKTLYENDPKFCRKNNAFIQENKLVFDKYLIVGHWPNSNYPGLICCNPKFDDLHKVIGIDGGNCIKSYGQLNALIISSVDTLRFSYAYYDKANLMQINHDQKEHYEDVPIDFGGIENELEIVEVLEHFTRIKEVKSGYRYPLPSHKVKQNPENKKWYYVDDTNYFPKLKKGEIVNVYKKKDNLYFIKKKGVMGWYKD